MRFAVSLCLCIAIAASVDPVAANGFVDTGFEDAGHAEGARGGDAPARKASRHFERLLPDAEELERLLAREAAQDPKDLYDLGLAYKNADLWEPDYEKAFSYFKRSEELGFPWAKAELGYHYEYGLGVEQDLEKAVRFYQEGADFGDAWSGLRLGYMYMDGEGVRKTPSQAYFWVDWASRQGLPEARSALGWLFEKGIGTEVDISRAAALYEEAAADGVTRGLVYLGLIHEYGKLGREDLSLAADYYRRAADEGDERGKHHLGTMYFWGRGVEPDPERAVALFREAIDGGYVHGHVSLGFAYEKGEGVEQSYERAASQYRQAIDKERIPAALAYLAWLHRRGLGVEPDIDKAIALYEEAVAAGNNSALTEFGYALVVGFDGFPNDVNRGRRLLEKAAGDGYGEALGRLAQLYASGTGVARDLTQALEYYEAAVELGNVWAMRKLGDLYVNGEGVERDYDAAFELYLKAYQEGGAEAAYDLGYLHAQEDWRKFDAGRALSYLYEADSAGLAAATGFLGQLYYYGKIVEEDTERARDFFKRATENGSTRAASYLGYMEEYGQGGPEQLSEAIRHYEISAGDNFLDDAERLVDLYSSGKDVTADAEKALKWKIRAGELGNSKYAFEAAEALSGEMAPDKLETASRLYRIAADAGNLDASVKWARLQILGLGETPDFAAGIGDLRQTAAENPFSILGPVSALVTGAGSQQEKDLFLGLGYANGIVVPQDLAQAETYLRRAAQGEKCAAANYALALFLLEYGPDTPETSEEFLNLTRQAADLGFNSAQLALAEAYSQGSLMGRNLVAPDLDLSLVWLRLAAESMEQARVYLGHALAMDADPDIDPAVGRAMLEDLAVAGNSEAAYKLAFFLHSGEGGAPVDQKLALRWFKKSARFGNVEALFSVALMHEQRFIEGASDKEAYRYLLQAAETEHPGAADNLAWHLEKGVGVDRDLVAAEEWYLKAVQLGNSQSEFNLAKMYVGHAKTFSADKVSTAVNLLHAYAEAGNNEARLALGWAYGRGQGVDADPERALAFYLDALAESPTQANTEIGNYYYFGIGGDVDYDKAAEHYSIAAELGSAAAQNNLGWMYENGLSVPQDLRKAISLYEQAIGQGDANAASALGILYRDGKGVVQDHEKAVDLFTQAIMRGGTEGRANLGWMMINGWGLRQDSAAGLSLIEEAAAENSPDGLYYLATLLEEGNVTRPDLERAVELYKAASEHGIILARDALKRLDR
ncbi:SEL1-like repeat protein [Rhodobacterales bacterium]|nr:SEL1-like repeat protein [Rhodobacterales bacterium]